MAKKVFCLIGPSATGKTTLIRWMEEELGIPELISHTTRQMREGEVDASENDGEGTYYFCSIEDLGNIEFVEETMYNGNKYGLSKKEINRKLMFNDKVGIIVEEDGYYQIRDFVNDEWGEKVEAIPIFVDAPDDDIVRRLKERDLTEEEIEERLEYDDRREYPDFEYSILNADGALDRSKKKLRMIVKDLE